MPWFVTLSGSGQAFDEATVCIQLAILLALIAIEAAIMRWRPAAYGLLAFLPAGSRRFQLPPNLRAPATREAGVGFRDAALAPDLAKTLPWPAMRQGAWSYGRSYTPGFTNRYWLTRIDARLDGDYVLLRARVLPLPLSLTFFPPLFLLWFVWPYDVWGAVNCSKALVVCLIAAFFLSWLAMLRTARLALDAAASAFKGE